MRPNSGSRNSLALAILLFLGGVTPIEAGKTETANGPTFEGVSAEIDLPPGDVQKNRGGSDGSGLCVFASIQMAARWSAVRELDDLFAWMTTQPGGGYPSKVDKILKLRAPNLSFVQYEGADAAILDEAIRTGRPVCVTYGYGEFYGGQPISHMVLLVHLDVSRAAIIDNNDPHHYTWMSRDEFLKRWKAPRGEGWCVVLLASPPPPVPTN